VRALVRLLPAAALAVVLTACGSGSESPPTSDVASLEDTPPFFTPSSGEGAGADDISVQEYVEKQQEYVDCLREHGQNPMDPDETGAVMIPTSEDKPGDDSGVEAAKACAQYSVPVPESVRKLREERTEITPAEKKMFAEYAECMQTNGAPDFPDPLPNGMTGDGEWDQTSAGARQATRACASVIGDPVSEGPGVG
jgi:hypothetical protein